MQWRGQTRAYTNEIQQVNDGKWYIVGTDGPYSPNPTTRFTTFPTLSQATYPTIYKWPAQQNPTFSWQKRQHKCYYYCDPTSPYEPYDRKYHYQTAATPAWGWGYSGTPPDGKGVMRYRVSATYGGVTKSSQDKEYATRLGVRSSSNFGLTEEDEYHAYRKKYLRWLYAYWGPDGVPGYGVVYEWRGVWYGGKASATWVGGGGGYEGYGIDCSGYVSACARWAGYGWTGGTWGWYYNTTGLLNVSKGVTQDQLEPGDILLKPGTHVYTVVQKHLPNVRVISAKGETGGPKVPEYSRVVEQTLVLADLIEDGYQLRRLVPASP